MVGQLGLGKQREQGKNRLPTLFNAFPALHSHLSAAPLCPVQSTAQEKNLHHRKTCITETPAQEKHLHKRRTCIREEPAQDKHLHSKDVTLLGRRPEAEIPMDGPSSATPFSCQPHPAPVQLPPVLCFLLSPQKKEVDAFFPRDLSQFS